jgi:hypothetical protein
MTTHNKTAQTMEYGFRTWLKPLTATAVGLLVLTACDKSASVKVDLKGCHMEYTMQPGDSSYWDIAKKAVGNNKGTNEDVVGATADAIKDARVDNEGITKKEAENFIYEESTPLELPAISRIGNPIHCPNPSN